MILANRFRTLHGATIDALPCEAAAANEWTRFPCSSLHADDPRQPFYATLSPSNQRRPIHELLSILSPEKKHWPFLFIFMWVDRLPKCARKVAI
ncbi:MAG: hypothetical protein QOJ15_11079 [Bradyrhizobium sp.]|nr:hypothetical protein [Bradyrhizobium sp.]